MEGRKGILEKHRIGKEKGKVGNIKWNGMGTMGGGPRGLIWKWAGPGDRPRAAHPALIRL
uniref:Uncharacterized protein n=1 Tax=Cucumis melo TaxID=3656 RepID=A0A9I9CN03_CUCME